MSKAPSPSISSTVDYTGVASVPVALKRTRRWVYSGSLKGLGRENGYRNHIYTFRINGIVQPGVGVEGYLGGPHGI